VVTRAHGINISYVPQMAIKSQALVDFVAKWTETQQPPPPPLVTQEHCSMYFDSSFALNGARGGVVLISPKGDQLIYIIRLHFRTTNNVVEYEALVYGLRIAAELVINQIMGELNCRDSCMVAYRQEVRRLEEILTVLSFTISSDETMR
jgi:hypothetical protein